VGWHQKLNREAIGSSFTIILKIFELKRRQISGTTTDGYLAAVLHPVAQLVCDREPLALNRSSRIDCNDRLAFFTDDASGAAG
jgi:hypothetical protein